jgi:predicted esterase
MSEADDPHGSQPVAYRGRPLAEATAAALLVHGRGATAESILTLVDELDLPSIAYLAPQAASGSWYPHSFLAPIESNEPRLSSALGRLATVVAEIEAAGIPAERIALLGFSQGACLTLELAVRHPRRYGAIVAFTGGTIGPAGTPREGSGSFAGTPAFLGSSDPDPHVPVWRFRETAELLTEMGASVTASLYPGMPHTVNRDEIDAARRLLARLT